MQSKVRVRFAPSPTGPLHIGGVRTALYNYLFAKNQNGTFVLRIEDTDQKRYVDGAEQYIIDALAWCGIQIDEGPNLSGPYGPYRQSERKELYAKYAQTLIDTGQAYYAFDSAESLDQHRKNHESKGKTFIYNWHNRLKLDNSLSLSEEEVKEKLEHGLPYVIRFKTPVDDTLELQDLIRGKITIDPKTLDDKILFKSDGMPTYHLANIVDDHLMQITHVIRGEEWLPSLALHHLLYKAFEWDAPLFAHLPLILKPTGNGKLSKRDGDKGGFPVFPLSWNDSIGYRDEGYSPEATINFLALLGWNPGTEQEIFSLDQLIASFSLDKVNKAGARFDPDKTKWFNQQWLQTTSNSDLLEQFQNQLLNAKINYADKDLLAIIALVKERAVFAKDLLPLSLYLFQPPSAYAAKPAKKVWKPDTSELMTEISKLLFELHSFDATSIETGIKKYIADNQLKFGQILAPLRLSIVGDLQGPDLFTIIEIIGKEETINRINQAIAKL